MIKNPALVEAFEKSQSRMQAPDFFHNLKIVEALYRESCLLGALPLKDPLESVEVDVRVAKVINSVR